ncbi:MAG: dihydroneopterin triphosphate diphosphatase [Thiotrichales bacterium]
MPDARVWKRPESVLVVVHTVAGEVLLLRRREPADFWQSVTGSLEWGETAADAARRELLEETGIAPVVLEDCHIWRQFPIIPPWRARYAPDANENREHWFRVCLPARLTPRLDPTEHTEFIWLPRAAAAAQVWSWTNRDAILAYVSAPPGPGD